MISVQLKHNAFMQIPTEEEAKEGFSEAFKDA